MRRGLIPARDAAWITAAVILFFIPHIGVYALDKAAEKAEPVAVESKVETERFADVSEPLVEEVDRPLAVSTFYDVPMSIELQAHIINECGAHSINPAIVFAMIERESRFEADAVGDNCNSFGLMQVQKKWHEERMERLGVTDLLDPFQNVTVGIDYLAELLNRGNGVEWALAAYNAGASGANKGYGERYAIGVLERSEELKVVTGDVLLQR